MTSTARASTLIVVAFLSACSGGRGGTDVPSQVSVPGQVSVPTVYASAADPRLLAFPSSIGGTLTAYGTKSAEGYPESLTALVAITPVGTHAVFFDLDERPERFVEAGGGTLSFEWFPTQGTVQVTADGPAFEEPLEVTLGWDSPVPAPSARALPSKDAAAVPQIVAQAPVVFGTVTGCSSESQGLKLFLDLYDAGTDVLLDRLLMQRNESGLWYVALSVGGDIVPPSITFQDCDQIGAWYAAKLCTFGGLVSLLNDLKGILGAATIPAASTATLQADLLGQILSGACNAVAPIAIGQWCEAFYQGPKIVGGAVDLQGRAEFGGQVVTGPRLFVDGPNDFPGFVVVPLGLVQPPVLTINPPSPPGDYVARGTFACVPPGGTTIVVVSDPLSGFTATTEGTFHPQGAVNHSEAVFVGGFPATLFHVIQAVLTQPGQPQPIVTQKQLLFGG